MVKSFKVRAYFRHSLTLFAVCIALGQPAFSLSLRDVQENLGVSWLSELETIGIRQLIVTPGNHQAFIDAIVAPTTKSIKMSMFHLSDPDVINALISKAKSADIELILDRSHFADPSTLKTGEDLVAAGVKVVASTDVFSITHTKYMLINNTDWFVTSINLTQAAATTRDLGIHGINPNIFAEILKVFTMDFANGDSDLQSVSDEEIKKSKGPYQPPAPTDLSKYSPTLSNPNLVWSPLESAAKIITLINSSKKSIVMTVENFKFPDIQTALVNAVARGVDVRLIVPQVDMNPNPNFNLEALYEMQNVKVGSKIVSVNSRLMPGPPSAKTPYMHLKMVNVDDETLYIGSENFTFNSLNLARELGIIFSDKKVAASVTEIFNSDWSVSVVPPAKAQIHDLIKIGRCEAMFSN